MEDMAMKAGGTELIRPQTNNIWQQNVSASCEKTSDSIISCDSRSGGFHFSFMFICFVFFSFFRLLKS